MFTFVFRIAETIKSFGYETLDDETPYTLIHPAWWLIKVKYNVFLAIPLFHRKTTFQEEEWQLITISRLSNWNILLHLFEKGARLKLAVAAVRKIFPCLEDGEVTKLSELLAEMLSRSSNTFYFWRRSGSAYKAYIGQYQALKSFSAHRLCFMNAFNNNR